MIAYGIVFLVAAFCNANGEDAYLPPYIKQCSYTDPDFAACVKKQVILSLPQFTKGIPELGVPSIDPINLDDIIIDGNGLKLSLRKAQMHGLSTVDVTDLKVNLKEESFTLKFVANMSVSGVYNIDGRILVLPIKGDGDCFIAVDNTEVEISSKLTPVKGKTGEHLKLVTPNYKYQIEKTTFQFKNLFNGNKELSDTMHQFANANWKQLMDDLAPPVIKQIVRTGVKAINKFFNKVTAQQLINDYPHD
ncbi:circadian clock-controlled protein daywake-like [Leguminivora glycinivorella]|uniref:circadian clock-controlled protein daywake-like n=1 Tax=Leguminivora glycinivorella TaxID=1035111 RepID=UPI00200E74FC|nr:circadian clock-controlled protein daywake-like [Leguminivora glycinivorella]